MPYTNSLALNKISVASKTKLGSVQVGDNINVSSSGAISVNRASSSTYGVVKIGKGLSSDNNGVISTTTTLIIKDRRNGLPVYVRTNGDDNNDGLTEATAVKTIARAITILYTLDFGYNHAIINVGVGTFDITGILFEKVPLCRSFAILSGAGKGQTILTAGTSINNSPHMINNNANWQFNNLTLRNTTSSGTGITVNNGTFVMLNMAVESSVPTTNTLVSAVNGGFIGVDGMCTFSGTVNHFLGANFAGIICIYNGTATFNGTVTGSTIFAMRNGILFVQPNGFISGSVNGKRYIANKNGVIHVQGRGPNVFPGTVAGEVLDGGIYD